MLQAGKGAAGMKRLSLPTGGEATALSCNTHVASGGETAGWKGASEASGSGGVPSLPTELGGRPVPAPSPSLQLLTWVKALARP